MSGKNRDVEWIAHVYMPSGEVNELTVMARDGSRYAALTEVYKIMKLSGPNDPKINGVSIQQKNKSKVYKVGRQMSDVPASNADPKKMKRYRVTAFCGPNSGSPICLTLKANTPFEALEGFAGIHKVPNIRMFGPYKVEIDNGNGWQVSLGSQLQAFKDGSKLPTTTPETVKRDTQVVTRIPTKPTVVAAVEDLFKSETKVRKPTYKFKEA